MEPVKKTEAPGYYQVIRFPMGVYDCGLFKIKYYIVIWRRFSSYLCFCFSDSNSLCKHKKLFSNLIY